MGWSFYNSSGQLLTAPASTATADLATVATTVTVSDNESTNENNVLTFVAGADSDGGNVGLESDGNLYYNPSTGTLAATILSGTVATATVGTTVTVTDNESTNENNLIAFVADAGDSTGAHGLEMDGTLHYNPSTGLVTATGFAGTLAGNVTGNASGTSGSTTGNAATVTTNANLTGVVTSSGNATAIADKAIGIAKLADGTDGELITWNASGVIAAVAVGSDGQVLTSGGAGVAPTFEAASSGAISRSGGFTGTEGSSTSSSSTILLTSSTLAIPAVSPFNFIVSARKTANGSDDCALGWGMTVSGGSDVICRAAITGNNAGWFTSTADEAQNGLWIMDVAARLTNYTSGVQAYSENKVSSSGANRDGGRNGNMTTDAIMPIGVVVEVIVYGISDNGANSVLADEFNIYEAVTS
jgi:hypothetical protein